MKVLVIPSWYGSEWDSVAGSFFREQSLALAASGVDTRVLAINPYSLKDVVKRRAFLAPRNAFSDWGMRTVQWNVPNLPFLSGINYSLRSRLGIAEARRIFRRWPPDIVHAHSYRAGLLASVIEAEFGIPYVVTEHSSEFFAPMKGRDRAMAALAFEGARERWAVSGPFANRLCALFGLSFGVMPNSVNTDFFVPETGPRGDVFTFIQVGSFRPGKRTGLLLEAFKLASGGSKREMRLRLVGEGCEREDALRIIASAGLDDRVEMTGTLSRAEARHAIASADCLVVSSDAETFGVSVIEALSCGIPVISTRCGGPEWILKGAPHCALADESVESLAGLMARAAGDAASVDRAEIRRFAVERFSDVAVASRVAAALGAIVVGGKKAV